MKAFRDMLISGDVVSNDNKRDYQAVLAQGFFELIECNTILIHGSHKTFDGKLLYSFLKFF